MSPATAPRAIVKDANTHLYELLKRIPFLQVSKPHGGTNSREEGELFPIDGFIKVTNGNKDWWLFLDIKSHAQLRDARQSVDYLKRYCKLVSKPAYPIFVSQYLSQSIRNHCSENNVGYFDFSGNCRIVFDQVFIEREVPPAETPEPKRLKSLFSLKSSRVIRRLLHDTKMIWTTQSLAQKAAVSASTVSLIKEKLLGDEYAARHGEGFMITQPERLLLDWARHYNSRQYQQIECYGKGSLEDLENRFADYCRKNAVNYAFTMFSGAQRVAPFIRGIQRAYAYISLDYNATELAAALDMKPVDSGGNFRLITPADDDILWAKQKIGEEFVVNDIQLYLDLTSHRGRGEENAEFLLEQRIRSRW